MRAKTKAEIAQWWRNAEKAQKKTYADPGKPKPRIKAPVKKQAVPFLARLAEALGEDDVDGLADLLGLDRYERRAIMNAKRSELANTDIDPAWHTLLAKINGLIGRMIGVREMINAKMMDDRQARLVQRARITREG